MPTFHGRPKVQSRTEFIALITDLASRGDSTEWGDSKVSDFLEALAGWLSDAHDFYANAGEAQDVDTASWHLFADAIQAATVYE